MERPGGLDDRNNAFKRGLEGRRRRPARSLKAVYGEIGIGSTMQALHFAPKNGIMSISTNEQRVMVVMNNGSTRHAFDSNHMQKVGDATSAATM